MIVKWEDETGVSYFDYVVHVSKVKDEPVVRLTRATLDHNLVSNEYPFGTITMFDNQGTVIGTFNLGPRPKES